MLSNCNEEQVNTYISANPNLGPEESESTNFGIIYEWDNHSVAVDFFETEIDSVVTAITVQDIIDSTIFGASYSQVLTSQGAYCTRGDAGAASKLEECFYNPINGNSVLTSGMDVKYSGLFETGVGTLMLTLVWLIWTKMKAKLYNGPVYNFVGLTSTPNYRYTVDVGRTLQAMPELLTFNMSYWSMADDYSATYEPIGSVDEWLRLT